MRVVMRILIYMVCLNLATGLIIELNGLGVGIMGDVVPTPPSQDVEEYQSQFNATEAIGQIRPTSGILDFFGYIISTLEVMWRCIVWLVAGFPLFLNWLGDSFIIDASARLAYNMIVGVLVALEAILATLGVIQFASDRVILE